MLGDLHETRPDNVRLDIKAIQRNDKCVGFICFNDDAVVGFVPVHTGTSIAPTRMMEPIRIAE